MLSFKHMKRGCTKTQVREEEYEALKQELHALEPFMRPQVLSQDVSTSHDLLTQDAQVLHAQPKKSSTRVCFYLDPRMSSIVFLIDECSTNLH